MYQPKPRKDEAINDTTEPLRICLSKVSVSPVAPLGVNTEAVLERSSNIASTGNNDASKEKTRVAAEQSLNNVKADKGLSPTEKIKTLEKTPSVKPEVVVKPNEPSRPALGRTDSDSWRQSEGKTQPPRRRSSNHHLQLSMKQSDSSYGMGGPQSAPLYSPADVLPPAFVPMNPYGSATYVPMVPGQMLMMTENGLYIPAQPMYGYYQGGYDGYTANAPPPPLAQSTSYDSTHSASNNAPLTPGINRSPRAGSKAIPIKAPGSVPPSGPKKSSAHPPVTLAVPRDKV
jgi:hypothetical protein